MVATTCRQKVVEGNEIFFIIIIIILIIKYSYLFWVMLIEATNSLLGFYLAYKLSY